MRKFETIISFPLDKRFTIKVEDRYADSSFFYVKLEKEVYETIKLSCQGSYSSIPSYLKVFLSMTTKVEAVLTDISLEKIDKHGTTCYISFINKDGKDDAVRCPLYYALLLKFESDCDLLIEEDIFERYNQKTIFESNGKVEILGDHSLFDDKTLKEKLNQAIDCENYELAQEIKEELLRRENKKSANF